MMSNHRGFLAMTILRWALLPCASGSMPHQHTRLPATGSIVVPRIMAPMSVATRGAVISARIITCAWPGSHAWRRHRLPPPCLQPHRPAQPPRPWR
jgi:hypothetical protein